MRDFYASYANDELWLIKETGWIRSLQNIRESQFALGNGYLGMRGVLEEIPYEAIPGTYITGLYDKMAAQVDELVNLPNPINFRFSTGGQKFDLIAMDALRHKRILNMKKGVLLRHTLYRDAQKKRYDYQSLRFLSFHDKNIGVMQIAFTPLDKGCVLDINTGIDTSVTNQGVLTEGRKRHFRVKEVGRSHNAGYLVVDTSEKQNLVIFWSGFYYQFAKKKIYAQDNIFRLKVKKGQTVVFTKVFFIKHFLHRKEHSLYRKISFKRFQKAFGSGFSTLLNNHIKVWERLWKKADIVIAGTASLQTNVRFNIYHMLICRHYDNGFSSIGARTLSGEGYRGHIFWDAEIFLMPFYLFNFPRVAKNMLLYRYYRLSQSKKLAAQEGFRGAKFAWESASSGEEETPEWAKNFDGSIIKIHTHAMEHHITADIAYAVYKYYVITGDETFMERYGYEMIFEAARFWTSRLSYNRRRRKYEIKHVIGPDEFHVDVDNNAFTNMMAKWNLITASKLFYALGQKRRVFNIIKEKIQLTEKEVREWKKIASRIYMRSTPKNKPIEQFEGYFRLENILLMRADEYGIPLLPSHLKPKDLWKTQLVKQADVLMLLYLLSDVFSPETKRRNYDFYIQRTVHKSSLSPSIHALIASEVGDLSRAYNLFRASLRTDISNIYGNTQEGIHAAALGGTWQAVIFGFAGSVIKNGLLFINPRMPRTWHKVVFSLFWKGYVVKLELTNEIVKIKVTSPRKRSRETGEGVFKRRRHPERSIEIGIFDTIVSLKLNKVYTFQRKVSRYKDEYYYY